MLRLIAVLTLAWIGSQFPAYYQNYVMRLDWDLRAATQAGAPQATLDAMKQQRLELIYAGPTEWPFALLGAWDTDRALATLNDDYGPRLPATEVEWAYGGVGLFLGFIVTGLLFAPFRARSTPAQRTPASRAQAPRSPAPARSATARAAAPAPQADAPSPWGAPPPQPKAAATSRLPVSAGSLKQAAQRLKRAARQAADAAGDGTQPRRAQPAPNQEGRVPGPRDGQQAVETRYRSTDVIVFARSRGVGVIDMSYVRPPLIERRRELAGAGPIVRVTVFRD